MGLPLWLKRVPKLWPTLLLLAAVPMAGCGGKAGSDPVRLKEQNTAKRYVELGENYLSEGDRKKAYENDN